MLFLSDIIPYGLHLVKTENNAQHSRHLTVTVKISWSACSRWKSSWQASANCC